MKFLVFGLVVGGLLMAGLLANRRSQHEPVFNGQPLSHWIEDRGFVWFDDRHGCKCANGIEFRRSMERETKLALRCAGEKALPYLIRDLHEHDSQFIKLYDAFLMRVPFELCEFLPLPETAARKKVSASIALQDIGPASLAAIAELRQLLTDDSAQVRMAAQETLRIIRAE